MQSTIGFNMIVIACMFQQIYYIHLIEKKNDYPDKMKDLLLLNSCHKFDVCNIYVLFFHNKFN